jgi:hypothetical protein
MSPFSKEDFSDSKIRHKLAFISQFRIGKRANDLLIPFKRLSPIEQREYNKEMNYYISMLPDEDWMETLEEDFNRIVSEELFLNSKFDPSKVYIPPENIHFHDIEAPTPEPTPTIVYEETKETL